MATLREIRRRIRSVRNIGQVTRALEAVSASKMRRAQERSLASRPYAEKAWEILTYLASEPAGRALHPLLEQRPVRTMGVVLITPDRGLCGGLPTNVIRHATRFARQSASGGRVRFVAVGRKGRDFMLRYNQDVYAEFTGIPDRPGLSEITPIARLLIDDFLNGTFDQVFLIYTHFISTIIQRPVDRQLLPIRPAVPKERFKATFLIEPDPETVLGPVLEGFTVLQLYQAILEAQASEHSARLVAMRNATQNAQELVADLTLTFNKARQEVITKELMDIVGGAEALAKARAR